MFNFFVTGINMSQLLFSLLGFSGTGRFEATKAALGLIEEAASLNTLSFNLRNGAMKISTLLGWGQSSIRKMCQSYFSSTGDLDAVPLCWGILLLKKLMM
jgi:hypothetical protein